MKNGVTFLSVFLAGVLAGCAALGNTSSSTSEPSQTASAELQATPSSASFQNVVVGNTSSQTISLANTGSQSATISSGSVSGQGFSITGMTFPLTIAAGQRASLSVVFDPTSANSSNGNVTLVSNGSNSSLVIPLSGSAVAATRQLTASATALSFGNVTLGTSDTLSVTLTNSGNADVNISGVSTSGTGFTASGVAAGTIVPPGATTTLNAYFSPSAVGKVTGGVSLATNATNATAISLQGTGVQASPHTVALNWVASTSEVSGYNVYRAVANGSYVKLNGVPLVTLQFTDTAVQSGQTYTYAVTSVSTDDTESSYSTPATVVIPST
jgi:hypothetical protein